MGFISVVASLTRLVLGGFWTHIGVFDNRHPLDIAFFTWLPFLGAVTDFFNGPNLYIWPAVSGCQSPISRPVFGVCALVSLGSYLCFLWPPVCSQASPGFCHLISPQPSHGPDRTRVVSFRFISFRSPGLVWLPFVRCSSTFLVCGRLVHLRSVHGLASCSLATFPPTARIYTTFSFVC